MTVAQVCFVLLDSISSALVPSSVAAPPIYSWYIYHCPCHLLADLHAGLTVVSCHGLVPTGPCPVISLRCHSKAPRTNTRVYPPTYLPNYLSTHLPTIYLSGGRILYPFICPSTTSYCFYFGKMGERIRTNSTKLTPSTGMGLRRRLCYAIYTGGRYYLSWRFLLSLYIGENLRVPHPNQHTSAP